MKAGFDAYPKAHSVRGKKKVKGKNPKKKQKENLAESESSEWVGRERERERERRSLSFWCIGSGSFANAKVLHALCKTNKMHYYY